MRPAIQFHNYFSDFWTFKRIPLELTARSAIDNILLERRRAAMDRKQYEAMFKHYPDVVDTQAVRKMMGGIGM